MLDDPNALNAYAVIVPISTMGTMTKEQEANIVAAVQNGVGLAGFHGGMGDSFRGQIGYQWLVGGQFMAHPENIKNYRVEIVKKNDPIVAGFWISR